MTTHIRRLLAAFGIAAAVALVAPASPVAAHEGGGTLTVESSDTTDATSVRYVVRLIWNNDSHPAAAADTTMTAVPVGEDGTALTPVGLEPVDDDGRFAATIEFPTPGAWTVRFTAITPEATLEVPQQIDPPSTTTTTEAPSTTSTEAATPTTDPPAENDEDEDGEASKAGTFVFVAVLLILAGAAFLVGRRVRQRRDPGSASEDAAQEQQE